MAIVQCLDSDILIDMIRGVPEAKAFLQSLDSGTTCISVVSVVELWAGQDTKQNEQKRNDLIILLDQFIGIRVSRTIAKQAGIFRRDYGTPFADSIIAASVYKEDVALMTKNRKDFEEVCKAENIELITPY